MQTHAELSNLTDEEIITIYDGHASRTSPGLDFYLNELRRRELAKESQRMSDMTRTMKNLTWWIFALTVVNVAAVVYPLLKQCIADM